MNAGLEFHDSEVASIEVSEEKMRVLFSAAYIHMSERVPGVDSGEGYVQAVELLLSRPTWKASLQDCFGRLSHGELTVGRVRVCLVPLPFEATEETRLELQFANGSSLEVLARSIQLRQAGEARFVEKFSC